MSGNLTWKKENGEWGVGDVDLAALPPAVYAAIARLKDIEHPSCPTNADRVRAMSDEELARIVMCPYDETAPELCQIQPPNCFQCSLDWLKDPA